MTGTIASFSRLEKSAFPYDATLHDLGTLGGCLIAEGINFFCEAVGYSSFTPCNQNALEYLNDLIAPGSGWTLYEAAAINDSGQIAGTAFISGQQSAIILDPVPEPATVLLIASGLALTGLIRRRVRGERARVPEKHPVVHQAQQPARP